MPTPTGVRRFKEKESDATIVEEEAVGPLAWQASFRLGAGMSIAALALTSTMESDGKFTRQHYLQTAEDAFAFQQKNNVSMVNDGKENIVDDYTALLAATELYRALGKKMYLSAAARAKPDGAADVTGKLARLLACRSASAPVLSSVSDAGLPVITLLE